MVFASICEHANSVFIFASTRGCQIFLASSKHFRHIQMASSEHFRHIQMASSEHFRHIQMACSEHFRHIQMASSKQFRNIQMASSEHFKYFVNFPPAETFLLLIGWIIIDNVPIKEIGLLQARRSFSVLGQSPVCLADHWEKISTF